MRINKNTKIVGNKCVLVPYRYEHVLKYHTWMQSEELQRVTGSEPLTLEEEYRMQQSWMLDENKCTFIVLDKQKYTERNKDEVESMIGDTNLFFANADDCVCAEAEIMIADESARSRGCGKEAMTLMFLYGIEHLNVKQFIVKIVENNLISIHLFRRFGFDEISRSDIFHEITFCKIVNDDWINNLKALVGNYEIVVDSDENE